MLLPRQKARANPWGCWNWFERRTARGQGEAAIVAAQIRAVRRRYRIDRGASSSPGMSAGGALAAVLGVRRPDLVAGVFVHSGVACGAASSPLTALGVMKRGADRDVARIARDARAANARARRCRCRCSRSTATRDDVVAPVNAAQLVRQYLRSTVTRRRWPAPRPRCRPPTGGTTTPDGRAVTTREWRRDGRLVVRHVEVDGLGHAWSGGDAAYPYNDPAAPDATALLGGFVREVAA